MADITVITKRALQMADIERLCPEVKEQLFLDDYENDEDLECNDYIWATVGINGGTYILIHGFPGDNPIGMIQSDDGRTVQYLGEGFGQESPKWYLDMTTDMTDYSDSLWTVVDDT